MRLSSYLIMGLTFVLAAGLCLVAAGYAVSAIEDRTEIGVRQTLDTNGLQWAEVEANGLQVVLSGTAPSEADRFTAISNVGTVVDAARIIDAMDVQPTADLAPPRFSAEILRNDRGISIIGLIPSETDRDDLIAQLSRISGRDKVTDLLETANYPAPAGWDDALGFSVATLKRLPRSKVSVDAGRIVITAITDSEDEKRTLEAELVGAAPPGLRVVLNVAAPRPVITPFTLRFLIDEDGSRFDACSADTEESEQRIVAAARSAGLIGPAFCTIGMGVPSPNWSRAVEASIEALAEIGLGSVTFSDADVTLVAAQGTDPRDFDHVVGELETALPDVFALYAVLPEPDNGSPAGPPEFVATLSPEGLVQLRGRLSDENQRKLTDAYAKSAFGFENVYTAARLVEGLPDDWPVRVLTGIEALSILVNGAVTVTPHNLALSGVTFSEDARAEIARLVSDRLGEAEEFTLDITYSEPPPPPDQPADPDVCEAEIAAIQETAKIKFEPGSSTISTNSLDTMEAIANILSQCGEIQLEIQGHTDSQGREKMNEQLSLARAQSVLNELTARRVLTSTYVARGYGEVSANCGERHRSGTRSQPQDRVSYPAPRKTRRRANHAGPGRTGKVRYERG